MLLDDFQLYSTLQALRLGSLVASQWREESQVPSKALWSWRFFSPLVSGDSSVVEEQHTLLFCDRSTTFFAYIFVFTCQWR